MRLPRRPDAIQYSANRGHDIDVAARVAAADIILLAEAALAPDEM